MTDTNSPYAQWAANYRDQGYPVIPCMVGAKVPGAFGPTKEKPEPHWRPMPGWQKYCDTFPPEFLHDKWEAWPDAGICLAHGAIVGLDLDTDDPEIANVITSAIDVPPQRRRGSKGWMAYYRSTDALSEFPARVRWYRKENDSGSPLVELLLHGTQSVLPPSIHPDTQKPYTWLTGESLADHSIDDLPELTEAMVDKLDQALQGANLTRQAPRRVTQKEYGHPSDLPTGHDLELPAGRSLNNRALEPGAIDQWWPELNLPKSRQRGPGAWEAVPFWRASNSGRLVTDRNPNLKAIPTGIVDFGADRSYTPIDVVMAARECSVGTAMEWLQGFVRLEQGTDPVSPPPAAPELEKPAQVRPEDAAMWIATPVFSGTRKFSALRPIALPSDDSWETEVPKDPPAFPIQDLSVCEGLLGEVAQHIDNASATATEAGGLAVALPLLGAIMGQAYATPTNLRTNVYTVALGGSGTGKTSLVNPAKELMVMAGVQDVLGGDRFASGSGVLKMLLQGGKRVSFLDEFGHMLQQMGSGGAGIHVKQILTEFTSLYSAANTIFTGTAYADGRENVIEYPHLCLFGMATPEQFWRAFGSASLEDGSIARYLVFPLGETADKGTDHGEAHHVAEGIKQAMRAMSDRKTGNIGLAKCITAPLDDAAESARMALKSKEAAFASYAEKNAVRGGPAILRRVTENALKIALISAVGRNLDSPEIDARDMEIGHALAWWSANVMISNIASHIADNQLERDVNDVERFIIEAGDLGRGQRDIGRRFRRLRKRDLQETLEALEEQGAITKSVTPNPHGGRSKVQFFAT
ncbi:MAG: bifunctional DNA primase/polymerase [Pseudomonadota bacterium]